MSVMLGARQGNGCAAFVCGELDGGGLVAGNRAGRAAGGYERDTAPDRGTSRAQDPATSTDAGQVPGHYIYIYIIA